MLCACVIDFGKGRVNHLLLVEFPHITIASRSIKASTIGSTFTVQKLSVVHCVLGRGWKVASHGRNCSKKKTKKIIPDQAKDASQRDRQKELRRFKATTSWTSDDNAQPSLAIWVAIAQASEYLKPNELNRKHQSDTFSVHNEVGNPAWSQPQTSLLGSMRMLVKDSRSQDGIDVKDKVNCSKVNDRKSMKEQAYNKELRENQTHELNDKKAYLIDLMKESHNIGNTWGRISLASKY
ncbi:hypothetical protein Tco_0867269 [Tanacetum coccineum]